MTSKHSGYRHTLLEKPDPILESVLISLIILLPEKFLPFDWLRAGVFQLNLKYLHEKIISYYGNPKSPNNLVAQITQKWRKSF